MVLWLVSVVLVSAGVSSDFDGTIQGVVVNGSHGDAPIGNAEVVLRAGRDSFLEPVAKVKTDANGKFVFNHVPVDPQTVYLPGADRDGVHYPGSRVHLDERNPNGQVTIRTFDTVESPSPLETLQHHIDISVDEKVLTVREKMLVSNSSRGTYSGKPVDDQSPVTLRLSVPPNFDRVTFSNEFYGRRFRIVDHQLVTDVPWPPGRRELAFTYRIPIEKNSGLFRRTLDIPCRKITLVVRGNNSKDVLCKFPLVQKAANETIFASVDKQLPAGYTVELQIGRLPVRWGLYARWSALGVLGALILGSVAVSRLHGRPSIEPPKTANQRTRPNSA